MHRSSAVSHVALDACLYCMSTSHDTFSSCLLTISSRPCICIRLVLFDMWCRWVQSGVLSVTAQERIPYNSSAYSSFSQHFSQISSRSSSSTAAALATINSSSAYTAAAPDVETEDHPDNTAEASAVANADGEDSSLLQYDWSSAGAVGDAKSFGGAAINGHSGSGSMVKVLKASDVDAEFEGLPADDDETEDGQSDADSQHRHALEVSSS